MKKNNNAFTENILKDPVLCLQFLKDYVDILWLNTKAR